MAPIIVTSPEQLLEILTTALKSALDSTTPPSMQVVHTIPAERWHTFGEICRKLRISAPTLRKMLLRGDIQGIRAGRNWRIPEASLQEYFQKTERK